MKVHQYPSNTWVGGPQNQSGRSDEDKSPHLSGIELQPSSSQPNHSYGSEQKTHCKQIGYESLVIWYYYDQIILSGGQ
jgi:hypothetical protein